VASSASAAPVGPANVGGFDFTADDGNVTAGADLTGYPGTATNVVIPSTVVLAGTTYSVTSIESGAFSGNSTMQKISIPNTVTSIGVFAFASDTALTSVTIPDSVVNLGNNAFQNDTALVTATVGNSVNGLQNSTFAGDSSLTTLVLGNSIGGVGDGSVNNDPALTSVTFGNSVSSLGNGAFGSDPSLSSVVFPATVTGFQPNVFDNANLVRAEFLGAAPTLFTAETAGGASLGSPGPTVYYPWAFDAAQVGAGGFTSPVWQGYNTVELATVSFDLKGHGTAIAAQKVAVGTDATRPDPTASGLIFNGWYTDSALTTKADFADPITADTTLFASWSTLAVTGVPLNPWLLPGSIAMFIVGLLLVVLMRRRTARQ
jgi:uncharacterized repeat protein (TIGR02543 family)